MVKKCFCLIFVFLLFYAGRGKASGIMEHLVESIPNDFSVDMKLSVSEWMPLDEQRCTQLSNLLSHVGLHVSQSSGEYAMGLSVDGQTSLQVFLRTSAENEELVVSTLPDLTFHGADGLLEALIAPEAGSVHDQMLLSAIQDILAVGRLDSGLKSLLSDDAWKTTVKNDRQNVVGYGTTERRVTFDLSQDPVLPLLENLPQLSMHDAFPGILSFDKNKLYLLVAENDIIHKASYTCSLNTESGLWKLEVSWKNGAKNATLRSAFKAEAVRNSSDSGKKETISWSCTREAKDAQEIYLWQCIHKVGSTQTVDTVSATLSEVDGHMTGNCEISESASVKGSKAMQILLNPDFVVSQNEPFLSGSLGYRFLEKGANPNAGTISISVNSRDAEPFPKTEETVDLRSMGDEERAAWSEKVLTSCIGALFRDLVLIDAADTEYLRQDMKESDWLKILYTAGPAVEEE